MISLNLFLIVMVLLVIGHAVDNGLQAIARQLSRLADRVDDIFGVDE